MIFKKSLKEWAILTQLFSTGERHKAFVSHVKEFGWPNSITPVLAIKSTLHINEKEYLNDQNIPLRWIERIDFPKVGTEIDVVYDKYNPSLFRFYNEKLEERFDVKKKINGER